jgi:hypothetical protein
MDRDEMERCKVVELFIVGRESIGLKNPLLYGIALYLA